MRVTIYGPDFNRKTECGWLVTYAMSEGLTKLGVEHEVCETRRMDPKAPIPISDVCVVNGWIKDSNENRGRITRNDIIRAHQEAGVQPWCIERGFLLDREAWSGLSIGGFCSNGGDFRAEGMPPDRWNKLGIELKPWRTDGDYVLLCAQVPWDAQVQDGNHLEWLNSAVQEIQRHTGQPIRFRGHPKAWRRSNPYVGLSLEFLGVAEHEDLSRPPARPFEEDAARASAVVCYNSNVATLANIEGIPAFVGSSCLAEPIASRVWSEIDSPRCPDREQWAYDMAYKQWHVDEFCEGLPWLHMTREEVPV